MGNILTLPKEKSLIESSKFDYGKPLSEILDLIGYSQEMIQFRRESNKLMNEIHNEKPFSVHCITTGGKAEGTALYFKSDIDRLYVVKGVTCVEPGLECSSHSLMELERSGCSPGYTRLKVLQIGEVNATLRDYLVEEGNYFYVANNYSSFMKNPYMIDINGVKINGQEKSGPSAPYGNKSINYDFVFGFKCYYPCLIEKWKQRPRQHEWPDSKLIERISTLEGHVVPVANKGSTYPQTEWRICYTKAELLLMHSFTEIQTKLYVLLKLVAKSVLKPLCCEMSSYIMKNVLFWMIENNPQERFLEEAFLMDRLSEALVYLRECIRLNSLKSYMIEDRNLFEGRIQTSDRESLLQALDGFLNKKREYATEIK